MIEALRDARASGVRVATDGHDLLLTAPAKPPAAVVEALVAQKVAIVEALSAPPPLDAAGLPFTPCRLCGGRDFWRASIVAASEGFDPRGWRCYQCAPPPRRLVIDACSLPPAAPGIRVIEAAARPRPAAEAARRPPPCTGMP